MGTDFLEEVAHRPWPLPSASWIWRQRWDSVLLLHYRAARTEVARRLPDGLEVDEHDGSAWVSLVPFRMLNVRPRGLLAFPPISDFAELNLRTYVRSGGMAGVYFFRIQAEKRLSAWLARTLSPLPYEHARMSFVHHGDGASFRSPHFAVDWRAYGRVSPRSARDGFLTERYCLYAEREGALLRAQVHHVAWPLAHVRARVTQNSLLEGLGVRDPLLPDAVHYASGVEVAAWPNEKLARP